MLTHEEWTEMRNEIKTLDYRCGSIRTRINLEKENVDRESAILKWISSHDIRASYINVLTRTKINGRYATRCQWFIESDEFKKWYSPGSNAMLWLHGTIGTGKTTVMARAIREMRESTIVDVDAVPLAMFFFQKSAGGSQDLLTVETCLQSLARQLSWNQATARLELIADEKFQDFKTRRSEDSHLTTSECIQFLKELISVNETYILIDGVDECRDPHELLQAMSTLSRESADAESNMKPLHIMLCGRSDLPVLNFFGDCISVTTNTERSKEDASFFIDSQIDGICDTQQSSLFCSSTNQYPDCLRSVLKRKNGGLFRWIEIQIDKFSTGFFREEEQIDDEMEWLEHHTIEDELDQEYARLLTLLEKFDRKGRNRERALKSLKLISCSIVPLDANDIAEAISAGEIGLGRKELTADSVRRILVGFISEYNDADNSHRASLVNRGGVKNLGLPMIRLAHASVREYLADAKSDIGSFSVAAQHSEAVLTSFSRIMALQQPKANLPPALASIKRDEPSYFLLYSCALWPIHLRRALSSSTEQTPLLEKTKEFLITGGRETWNEFTGSYAVEKRWELLCGFDLQGLYPLLGRIWTDNNTSNYGFLVAGFDFVELLQYPEIRDLIYLHHRNRDGITLLHFMLNFSKDSTVERMLELYSRHIANVDDSVLVVAARTGNLAVVKSLLDRGSNIDVRDQRGNTPLSAAMQRLWALTNTGLSRSSPRFAALRQTTQLLLTKQPYLYEWDKLGRSLLHLAVYPDPILHDLPESLIDAAIHLEKKGMPGSVQRLLRMRDSKDDTPADIAAPDTAEYLTKQLDEAVSRDGRILYDLDTEDIKATRPRRMSSAAQWLLSHRTYKTPCKRPAQKQIMVYGDEFKKRLEKRRRELDRAYREEESFVHSG